ncbi:hypothetical protein IFM89_018323 [Coptis chinensis]|uniref:SET domain-containing protein n=1 Tax=Coptis chinensis TaxID=261450 RepID=A0A835LIY6_9MAGN|nr:hypothetical protein IFM89_018323 [Coptis chinensis]
MDSICPLDIQHSDKISALLKPPSSLQVQASFEYFDQLVKTKQCHGLKVKQDGVHGKGVYAETDFNEGELVLKDEMLVGAQHSSNKVDCLVCSYCFCFIGSIELQIGRKLYLHDLGLSGRMDCAAESSDEEDDLFNEDLGQCSSSGAKKKIPLPKEAVESLMNGHIELPYSNKFSLSSAVPCPGKCGETYYCSELCADADWESFHSLLCVGENTGTPTKEALLKFVQHADGTNDIFYLAAKAISFTVLRYRKLKAAQFQEQKEHDAQDGNDNSDFSLLLQAWRPVSMGYKRSSKARTALKFHCVSVRHGLDMSDAARYARVAALVFASASTSVSVLVWWECVALPDDVDCCDEESFRGQIRELAFEFNFCYLLNFEILFKCVVFSLEIYGHIIGMFELNNLDLVVASPVEDYFLYIDDLQQVDKEQAERTTRPVLDALGDEYSMCCQGSAFFPLQSCMNHSCRPNAKAFKREEDRDGQATIIAVRRISEEEVTISYIDEDLPFKERQALLADYGFKCMCSKCVEEEL